MYHQIIKKRERDIDFLKIEIKQKENFISGYRTQIDRLGPELGLGLGLSILKLQKEIENIQKEINEIEEENKNKPIRKN